MKKCSCAKKGYIVFSRYGKCLHCKKPVEKQEDVFDVLFRKALYSGILDYYKKK